MTPIHGRVTNIRVRTSVPIGIQQLSQQVQVLINTILVIQEQLRSLLYNKQKSQPTALSGHLQIQKENRKNNMPSRYHTPTLHMSQHSPTNLSHKHGYSYQSSSQTWYSHSHAPHLKSLGTTCPRLHQPQLLHVIPTKWKSLYFVIECYTFV